MAGACQLGEGAACYPSSGLPVSPGVSVVTWVLCFPKGRELSSLPAGEAGAKKSEKCTLVQVVPTLGTFWNFQAEAVLAGVGENKVLAFQHFS